MAFTRGEIQHEGYVRTYHFYHPGGEATPDSLVVVLHGGGGDGPRIARITHFNDVAEREGFCVVYPDGLGNAWNDGRATDNETDPPASADDVGFLTTLLESLATEHGFDSRRVFAAGASNGAMMCHRLACERSDAVAGIAMVMGAIPVNAMKTPAPSRPVPAIMINGTEDPIVPWEGGPVRVGTRTYGHVASVADMVAFWVRHNRAALKAEREWLPHTGSSVDTRAWREEHPGATNGADVVLYGVEGGGHTWPGGEQYLAEWIIGKTNRDFDASETIWAFFKNHQKAVAD